MSIFKVSYKLTNGERGSGAFTGPEGATVEKCLRVAKFCAPSHGIDPNSITVESIPERTSKGFLHPLHHRLPDGRMATMEGWYV